MAENPKLSVCIPTYNRAGYIGDALESVVSQYEKSWDGKVEICVSDNASTDETELVVSRILEKNPIPIIYHRNEKNIGFDRNMLAVIGMARGRYCWFLGSDDIIEPGGISEILKILEKEKDLAGISVSCNNYSCDLSRRIFLNRMLPKHSHSYHHAEECFRALGFHLGYISGQIINRDLWNRVVNESPVQNYFNGYVHIYVILKMLKLNSEWIYLSSPLVGWRSGNDDLLSEQGHYSRLELDVVGYRDVVLGAFGRGRIYHDMMSLIGSYYARGRLMTARSESASSGFFLKAFKLCVTNYWRYPAFWFKTFPLFLMPSWFYKLIRPLYRLTLKKRLLKEQGLAP
jgi:abequosyltransferase